MAKKHSPPKTSPPKATPRKTFRRVPRQPIALAISAVLFAIWMIALAVLAISS